MDEGKGVKKSKNFADADVITGSPTNLDKMHLHEGQIEGKVGIKPQTVLLPLLQDGQND